MISTQSCILRSPARCYPYKVPVAAGSVRFFNGAVMGIVYFLFAAHLRKAGMFFHEDGFGAVGNPIMQSVLGSKHCLTKDISMVLESGSQGIQLLYKSSDLVKKATFNPKVDYFAPKA